MTADPIASPARTPRLPREDLLRHFPDAQPTQRDPNQQYATCPACGQGPRVLSIRLGGEQYAYPMHCRLGCSWERVMAAANLRWEDVAYVDQQVAMPSTLPASSDPVYAPFGWHWKNGQSRDGRPFLRNDELVRDGDDEAEDQPVAVSVTDGPPGPRAYPRDLGDYGYPQDEQHAAFTAPESDIRH